MPKFRFTITRDTTESAVVTIDAPSIEEAHDIALDRQREWVYTVDEGNDTDAYIPDEDDFEEIDENGNSIDTQV